MDRSGLISQIEQKLRLISAHDLQLLAEDFAKIRFPDRFLKPQLIRPGRNVEAQTTKGWPDAFVAVGANGADAIEATRDRANWEKHLKADYGKARTRVGRELVGYVFIGGYPENDPSSGTIEEWVRKFHSLGIPKERITILVGKELAFELAAPEFSRLCQDILGIPSSPSSFVTLATGLLGDGRLGAFQPSKEDFELDRVWRPPLLETIIEKLKQEQCALVRGHGASGKTTLVQLFATDPSVAPFPVYYLDLNRLALRGDTGGAAKNDIVQFCGANVTFVVDNIHLDELLANDLVAHWQTFAKAAGSRLLLLGREIERRSGTALAGINALVLRAGRDAMRGVVNRLFSRYGRNAPQFSDEQVDQWLRTFGGEPSDPEVTVDLIAFSAAAEARLQSLGRGDYRLRPSDAVDAIRMHYFRKIRSVEEKENLFRLSALAPLELALPAESLPNPAAAFDVSHRSLGLVLADRVGRDGRTFYQLAHPALGELLLAAFGSGRGATEERASTAREDVWLGIRIHDRLRRTKEQQQISVVLANEFVHSDWAARMSSLGALMSSMRRATLKKYVELEVMDRQIAEHPILRHLYLTERTISSLRDFNARLSAFPKTLATVVSYANNPSQLTILRESLYLSCTEDVASFLRSYPTRDRLIMTLEKDRWDQSRLQIRENAYQPVQTIMALRYLEQHGRPDLVDVPSQNLLAHSIQKTSQERWASANLDHLSHFLRMAASASVAEKGAFFLEVAKPQWLSYRYDHNRLGVISGALFSLSNHLDLELRKDLVHSQLWKRIRDELTNDSHADNNRQTRAICLLGAAGALLGDQLPDFHNVAWPTSERIGAMIELYARRIEAQVVGTHELQLWFGLRTMMRWRRDSVSVPTADGKRILALIQNSVPPTALGSIVLKDLENWLTACQRNGWSLRRSG